MNASDRRQFASHSGLTTGTIIVGCYRYLLWRTWDDGLSRLLWVLLNPSTADDQTDDQTLRRCMGFSREARYGGVEIANLFAFRTPYPQQLWHASDPVGSENDRYLAAAAQRAGGIVVAWGDNGIYQRRDRVVLALLACHSAQPLLCLGTTRNGCPRHPLRLARTSSLVCFRYDDQ